ncbi:3-oxoadipate enol-lactonase [Dietzia sp.]|uniref:3-oxoadipate enol-lactonase n=1 Tax=Dietzia sp. TaxID=1871616 RepID=UPI002FDB8C65
MSTAILALDAFPTKSIPDGIPDLPIVLIGSLGSTRTMWIEQIAALCTIGPVYAVDLRGHGDSQVIDEPASMSDLAKDVLRALDLDGISSAHFVGLSIGGAIAQQIALDAPERVERLVLTSTAPKFGTPEAWAERAEKVRADGVSSLVDGVLSKWFTEPWAAANPDVIANIRRNFERTDPTGYARCCEALAGFDSRERLGEIAAPTLVVSADDDGSTPPDVVRPLAAGIPGARFLRIEDGAHLCNIECADEYNAAVVEFLRP